MLGTAPVYSSSCDQSQITSNRPGKTRKEERKEQLWRQKGKYQGSNVCCAWDEPSTSSDIRFLRACTELPLTEMEALACKEQHMTGVRAKRKISSDQKAPMTTSYEDQGLFIHKTNGCILLQVGKNSCCSGLLFFVLPHKILIITELI